MGADTWTDIIYINLFMRKVFSDQRCQILRILRRIAMGYEYCIGVYPIFAQRIHHIIEDGIYGLSCPLRLTWGQAGLPYQYGEWALR